MPICMLTIQQVHMYMFHYHDNLANWIVSSLSPEHDCSKQGKCDNMNGMYPAVGHVTHMHPSFNGCIWRENA